MSDDEKIMAEVWRRVEEKENNLKILNGLERKKESDMLFMAKEFLGRMGIKGLFYGIADVIGVSMMITIGIFICISIFLGRNPQYVYGMLFVFSPTLYACIFCLVYVKETQLNTISVQMSCRYTFFHILLFRMLLNSGLAIVFDLIYICALNHLFELNLVRALALAFSSLMLFSVMLLKFLGRKNKLLGFAEAVFAWFGINLLAFYGVRTLYMGFINQIPFSVLVLAAFLFGILYYGELKKIISMNYKRRYLNA